MTAQLPDPLSMDALRLVEAGWRRLRSGRWVHPELPLLAGRRRVFSEGQALTLLGAVDSPTLELAVSAFEGDPED